MHRVARTALLVLLGGLLIFGVCMLYSTSFAVYGEHFLKRQLMWVALGLAVAALVYTMDYRGLGRHSGFLLTLIGFALAYLAGAYLLHRADWFPDKLFAALPLVPDVPTKGSFRWLRYGPLSMQPSEFAKPFLVLYLSDYYSRHARHVQQFKRGFLRPVLVSGAILGLVFAGRDLSTTVITGMLVVALMFVAGVRVRYLVLVILAGLLFIWAVLAVSPERKRRFTVYQDPEPYQRTEGYQLWHSQLALGSGGVTGLGFTDSRMKQFYLPEAHTDFIVAIVGEELGFVWVVLLLVWYCLLTGVILWIAGLAADRMGVLICVGVGLFIGIQALINVSVVSGFAPTTGVTAPFLSYGGSSMIASLLGIGLVLSVSRVSAREALRDGLQSRFKSGLKQGGHARGT